MTTIHGELEADVLAAGDPRMFVCFDGTDHDFLVQTHQMSCRSAFMFGAKITPSQPTFHVQSIYLFGASLESAQHIFKKSFPTLMHVFVQEACDKNTVVMLQRRGFKVEKLPLNLVESFAERSDIVGDGQEDKQKFLAYVRKNEVPCVQITKNTGQNK